MQVFAKNRSDSDYGAHIMFQYLLKVSIARMNPINNQHFLLAANLGIDLYEVTNQSMELIHVNKKAHNRYINDLDWNYDSKYLFATGSRNEIGFWDTRQGGIVQMKDLPVNIMGVSQLKWCKLDRNILASAQGNDVKIWDFRNLSQSMNVSMNLFFFSSKLNKYYSSF